MKTGENYILKTFFIVIFFFGCVYFLQLEIEGIRKDYPKFEHLLYLPTGNFVKSAALGFDEMTADILYIKALGYFGGHYLSDKEYKWLYHILDITTTLSPRFKEPYEFGAVILALEAGEVENANKLLKKAIEHNPQYWQFPFYLAFNHFFYLQDYASAASYMEQASKLPDAPEYIPLLSSRLYAQAQQPEYAISFLTEIYNETDNKIIKEKLEIRMKELIIERDLNWLEQAVTRYTKLYSNQPSNLEELTQQGLIEKIPQEPFGGYYYLDDETGVPKSSTHPERLRIYR